MGEIFTGLLLIHTHYLILELINMMFVSCLLVPSSLCNSLFNLLEILCTGS